VLGRNEGWGTRDTIKTVSAQGKRKTFKKSPKSNDSSVDAGRLLVLRSAGLSAIPVAELSMHSPLRDRCVVLIGGMSWCRAAILAAETAPIHQSFAPGPRVGMRGHARGP
jgi:hypothetical protein